MKQISQKIISNSLNVLLVLTLIWIIQGIFPIVNIEGDASFYIAGCERLYQNGIHLPPDYIYQWNMQPLTAIIILALKSVIPLISCQTIYVILSAISGLLLLFISAFWLQKRNKKSWKFMLLVLLLIPESYSIMYYPNTAVFASLFFWTAILFIEKKSINIFSLLLLGLAPLFRVDILVLYPFVLFLLLIKGVSYKKSAAYTFIYACSTIFIWGLGCFLLHANPIQTIQYLSSLSHENSNIFKSISQFHLAFYTPIFLLTFIFGIYIYIKKRNWMLLIFYLSPIILFYYIYIPLNGWGPKHLLYLIPIYAIFIYTGIDEIKNKKYLMYFSLIIFVFQSIIGIIYLPIDKPWITKKYSNLCPYPSISNFTIFKNCNYDLRLSFSTGTIISTSDELMPISGYLYAPFMWHNIKKNVKKEQEVVRTLLEDSSDTLYIASTQSSFWPLTQILHMNHFSLVNPNDQIKEYRKNKKIVYIYEDAISRDIDSFNSLSIKYKKRPLYLLIDWDWQKYYINEKLTEFKPISNQLSVIE